MKPVSIIDLHDASDNVTLLDNGGRYSRKKGKIIGAPDWISNLYDEQAKIAFVDPPPALIGVLHDVNIQSRGVIVTQLGEVIRESLINTHGLLEFGPFKRERVGTELLVNDGDLTGKRQDIKNAVLLKQLWDTNYGHWLIETLPRLELVDECFDIAKCKFIIGGDRGAIGQVYLDTLALFGVPNENIVRLDEASSFENLIYPAPLTIQPWIKAPRVIKFLERLGQKALSDYVSPSRLYVSRDSNAKRVLLNEEAVLEIVLKYGFFPIDPGRVDFQSQVRMFRNATHVIGNLGAAMTNVVFAPRGVKVLALATQCMQDDFFWDLVCQKEGEYVSLHGNAITPASGMYSDFRIDIEQLSGVMAEFV